MSLQWPSPKMVQPLIESPWITYAQITQVLKFWYGRYLGNYRKKKYIYSNNILSHYATYAQHDKYNNCFHVLSCCKTNTLIIYQQIAIRKTIHALANTLLAPSHYSMLHTNQHQQIPRLHSGQHYTIMAPPLHMLRPMLPMLHQSPPQHTMHPRSTTLSQTTLHSKPQSKNTSNWFHLL